MWILYGPPPTDNPAPPAPNLDCTWVCCTNGHNGYKRNENTPEDHCPIHKLKLIAGWCSDCDLERMWAQQRPHLELV